MDDVQSEEDPRRDVEEFLETFDAAWNARDASAWADHFAPDGGFVNVYGGYRSGRDDIRAGTEITMKVKSLQGSTSSGHVLSVVRPLGGGKTLVLISGGTNKMTLILEKVDNRQQIIWFHNTIPAVRPDDEKRLRDEYKGTAEANYDPKIVTGNQNDSSNA